MLSKSSLIVRVGVLIAVLVCIQCNIEKKENSADLSVWQQSFRLKRSQQLIAVKHLMENDDVQSRMKTLKILTDAMRKVIVDSRIQLNNDGFEPGMPFPSVTSTKDTLSRILENTAFIAELTLHLPDLMGKLLKKDPEFHNLIVWSVEFCDKTGFFDDSTAELINLFSQEINLVERNENYVNPYRESHKREIAVEEAEKLRQLKLQKLDKKKKKEQKKGPRLSSSRNGEL